MGKEKSEGEQITYLGSFEGCEIFSKGKERLIASSKEGEPEWYAVMHPGMFHKRTNICKSWKDLRRKLEHNKKVEKLCKLFKYKY